MDASVFLIKFWGWYLMAFFLVLSLQPSRINQIFKDLRDEKFLMLISFLAIIVGLLNILFHNVWEFNEKLIVTLIGWGSLLIGLSLFVFPKATVDWLEFVNIKWVQFLYLILFFVGAFLLNTVYQLIPF